MLRYIEPTAETYVNLKKVDPRRVTDFNATSPTGYWLQANNFIILDAIPDQDYDMEMIWSAFTDWPTDLNASPWLVQNETSLLLAETLLEFSNFTRDAELRQDYSDQRDIAYKQSIVNDEMKRAANEDNTMAYTGFRGER